MVKKIKQWLLYARAVALPQSILPALAAICLAVAQPDFSILYALLATLGVAVAHLAFNLLDDYCDFHDNDTFVRRQMIEAGKPARGGKCEYLTSGLVSTKKLLTIIILLLLIACMIATVIAIKRGAVIFVLMAITAVVTFSYSAKPFQLNAKGGKELLTGIIFGPLLVSGVYYSACGTFTSNMWIISAIVGFSVLNIAYVHAVVDAETDKAMHRITIPILLKNRTLIAVFALIFAFLPVVITLIGCCTHILSWWYILIGLALPRTIALAYYMLTFSRKENEHISPKKWMGSMQYWSDIQAYHIEWFMIRWYLARNTMSLYLLLIMIASILTWIIQ